MSHTELHALADVPVNVIEAEEASRHHVLLR